VLTRFVESLDKQSLRGLLTFSVDLHLIQSNFTDSDTTAISLTAVVYFIINNHIIHKKINQESMMARMEGVISKKVRFEQSPKLPTLSVSLTLYHVFTTLVASDVRKQARYH